MELWEINPRNLCVDAKAWLLSPPSDTSVEMGGAKKFDYPKYVWSPTGGWWCNPRNWKRNTALCFAAIFVMQIPLAYMSWSRERRYVAPYRHTFSQRFQKHAKEDDPSLPDNYQWLKWSK